MGKRADLVVLDRDILSIDPETIENTRIVATYLDGRLVYVYRLALLWNALWMRRLVTGGASAKSGCVSGFTPKLRL